MHSLLSLRITGTFIVTMALFSGHLLAGVNRWTRRGPDGGSIRKVIADPQNASVLYIAVFGAGVYKTVDGGMSWRPLNEGMPDANIVTLAMAPGEPATLFAGTNTGTILRTRDRGEHWTVVAQLSSEVQTLEFDISTLYALYGYSTIIRSDDGGDTWQQIALSGAGFVRHFEALDGRLYVVSDDGGLMTIGVDGRMSRQKIPDIYALAVAVDAERSTIVVGSSTGIARSIDGGSKWEFLPALPLSRTKGRVNALVAYSDGVLVATDIGVLRFANGTTAWTPVGSALAGTTISAITRTSSAGERLFGFDSGTETLYSWSEEQGNWNRIETSLLAGGTTNLSIAGSVVYAASAKGLTRLAGSDPAMRWELMPISSNASVTVSAVAASTSGVVFAGSSSAVHKSADSGATWKSVTPAGGVTAIGATSDGKSIYAALADGMVKSTDGGSSWIGVQNGMSLGYYFWLNGFYAASIEVDPTDAKTVYVAAEDGLFKSVDEGGTWQLLSNRISRIAVDSFDPSLLYARMHPDGMVRSTDAGKTWEPLAGLDGFPDAIAVNPAHPLGIYVATWKGTIYRSTNAGRLWQGMNNGFPPGISIRNLAVDSSGNRVFAATSIGVFEYQRDANRVDGATTHSVSLRTSALNFVSAEGCGDSRVTANAKAAGLCESFTLFDVNGGLLTDGDSIYLQAANESFVAAEQGGSSACHGCESPLTANRAEAGPWETFKIHKVGGGSAIHDGDRISLQSSAGDYIAAERGGSNGCNCDSLLNATRPVALEWETFTIVIRPTTASP